MKSDPLNKNTSMLTCYTALPKFEYKWDTCSLITAVTDWSKSLSFVGCCRLTWNSPQFIWMWLQYCTQNILHVDFLYSLRELECECPKQVGKEDKQFNSCHLFPQTYTVSYRKRGKEVSCVKLSCEKELKTILLSSINHVS